MASKEKPRDRAQVIEELTFAARESSLVSVMFHTAVSAQRGLSATESKTLDRLEREGPHTAKELAERSGLAPASVTGLVDRLVRKGYVRRVPHPTDKRRVTIESVPEKQDELARLFRSFADDMVAMYESYTVEELDTVRRFLLEAADVQRRAATRLSEPGAAD
ncbi:MarR family winged helix-turn-helix transcriptional regulator [Streptomyces sulphureus]|uniref:MarR family winged helix-turn-helix transcriptional regulator n=1 Tax=Streptomyces sulphureus TaxID=47758 RepID=UPI00035CE2AC|nr:MarR family transcriptional regulator [Streptomyces sulphureus]